MSLRLIFIKMKEVKITLPNTLSLARLCMELRNCRLNHIELNKELGRLRLSGLSCDPSYEFIPQFMRKELDTFKIIIEKSCKYSNELKNILEKFREDDYNIDNKDIVYVLNRPREPIDENERPAFFQIVHKIAALEDTWPIFPGSFPYNEIRNEDGEIFTLEYISSEFSMKERLFKLFQQYYGEPLVKEGEVIIQPKDAPSIVMAMNYAPATGSGNMLLELVGKKRLDRDLEEALSDSDIKRYPDLYDGQSLFGKHQEGLIQICKIRPWTGDKSASIDFCDMYLGRDLTSLKKDNDTLEVYLK